MTLSTIVTARIQSTLTKALDLATGTVPLDDRHVLTWSSGTGANQADLVFHDRRTLTASSTEDLDLAGVLADAFGTTLTFVQLKSILVAAASTNVNNVQLTRPASNGVPLFLAAGDGVPVAPGGFFFWADPNDGGVTVTAGTGDLLTVTNGGAGTSVIYDVVITGVSA